MFFLDTGDVVLTFERGDKTDLGLHPRCVHSVEADSTSEFDHFGQVAFSGRWFLVVGFQQDLALSVEQSRGFQGVDKRQTSGGGESDLDDVGVVQFLVDGGVSRSENVRQLDELFHQGLHGVVVKGEVPLGSGQSVQKGSFNLLHAVVFHVEHLGDLIVSPFLIFSGFFFGNFFGDGEGALDKVNQILDAGYHNSEL